MVLIIVSRNIDLSVGSLIGFLGMAMGNAADRVHAALRAAMTGRPPGSSPSSSAFATRRPDRRAPGFRHRLLRLPAFIVTLGALLIWRGAALVGGQRSHAGADGHQFRQLLGGGAFGTIGATLSWIVGCDCLRRHRSGIINGRRQRVKFDFPLRPVWAELTLCRYRLRCRDRCHRRHQRLSDADWFSRGATPTPHNIPWPETGEPVHLARHGDPGAHRTSPSASR